MKSWYSKVRDTELIDGSIRADYIVVFETDNFELKREVEKYLQGIMDRADRKDEPTQDQHAQHVGSVETMSCQECKWLDTDEMRCFIAEVSDCKYEPKDEPQTDGYISGEDFLKMFGYEPQTEDEILREQCKDLIGIMDYTRKHG